MKYWMIVTVENEVLWPAQETTVDFMGNKLILRPPTEDAAADVGLQYEHPVGEPKAFEIILRFLSALSWSERCPAHARLRINCTKPMRGGKGNSIPILCQGYSPSNLKEQTNPDARLAIAIYREAKSVNNTSYEFLSYYKIINILYHNGSLQKKWINSIIPQLTDRKALERIKQLKSHKSDIGAYLYGSGRCAIAHTGVDPVIDPDDPNNFLRISADMPVVQALAEYLMINELGLS
jgi:hypothetical protein